MRRRLICGLLCLLMLLILGSPALAAKEMFMISHVDLQVTAPQTGANPVFSVSVQTKNVSVVTDATFPFVNGVNWHQFNPANDLVESNTFASGLIYSVTVRVQADQGYGFTKNSNGEPEVTATVNGITASVIPVAGTDRQVDITLRFDPLAKLLTNAAVTGVDAPVTGKTLDYTADMGSSNYKLLNKNDTTFKNGITWYDTTDMKYVSTDHKAIAGHAYMVEIHVVPASGCEFTYDLTGSINGNPIDSPAGGGSEVALLWQFPTCADKVTGVPWITLQPQNPVWPNYSYAEYTVKASGGGITATWYIEYKGKTYNICDFTNGREPWEDYAGETYDPEGGNGVFTCFFGGIEKELDGALLYCVLENSKGKVTSAKSVITVSGTQDPPVIEVPVSASAKQGEKLTLNCKATGSGLSYVWYETSTGKLQDIQAVNRGAETKASFSCDTSKVGTRYYVCGVTNSAGGICYSSIIPVTVKGAAAQAPEITTKSLPDAVVGKAYNAKLSCSDADAAFAIYYDPGKDNDFNKTGLTLTQHGELEGTPTKAGTYTFAICAAGEGGEDYAVYTLTVKEAAEEETTVSEETTADEATEQTEKTVRRNRRKTDEDQDLSWWIYIPIALGAIALCAGVAILIIKKKK